MYIATNEYFGNKNNILSFFPQTLRRYMCNLNFDKAEEIRLIQGQPLFISYSDGDYYVTGKGVVSKNYNNGIVVTRKHLDEFLERITKSSVYTLKDEIRNGYITIDGGHRVGLCGSTVTENDRVEFIKNISSVNVRIANEIKGVADSIIGRTEGKAKNLLIISPPGCGKTTLLRDLVRQYSYMDFLVAVADERSEIGAMYNGISSFDLGPKTVVMDNCRKTVAMQMLLRSMSPDIIATDELGTENDICAVEEIMNSGVKVMATVHCSNREQLKRRKTMKGLAELFDIIIVLSKRNGAGTTEEILVTENDV